MNRRYHIEGELSGRMVWALRAVVTLSVAAVVFTTITQGQSEAISAILALSFWIGLARLSLTKKQRRQLYGRAEGSRRV